MEDQKEKLSRVVKNWLEENRAALPINIDSWQISFFEGHPGNDPVQPVQLGKYNAGVRKTMPLYKPYSKMSLFKV